MLKTEPELSAGKTDILPLNPSQMDQFLLGVEPFKGTDLGPAQIKNSAHNCIRPTPVHEKVVVFSLRPGSSKLSFMPAKFD